MFRYTIQFVSIMQLYNDYVPYCIVCTLSTNEVKMKETPVGVAPYPLHLIGVLSAD